MSSLSDPTRKHAAITPDDANDLPTITRSIYIGTGGDLEVDDIDGRTEIYRNLPDGFELQGHFRRVRAANTTAGDLIARY